jgi:thiosulfate/3-mercaptopyruvate sulfurtransferase
MWGFTRFVDPVPGRVTGAMGHDAADACPAPPREPDAMDTLFPLIRADALRERLARGERLLLCDCRFDLSDTALGERAYAAGHLPGAVYLHLDRDLSGPRTGRNGRHPLPDPAALAARLAALGADDDTPVVAYDASGGMFAARAWWLLR